MTHTLGSWLNVGGSDDKHPSGLAYHHREFGAYLMVMQRAELTAEILGRGSVMGLWMPFGVRRDRYPSGKLRFWYENEDKRWGDELLAGITLARQQHRVEVWLYLGKISLATESEFLDAASWLVRCDVKTVVIDNLNETGDTSAALRCRRLREHYGIRTIISEFPEPATMPLVDRKAETANTERQPHLSDEGFAVDMRPNPRSGGNQGASLAEEHGMIPGHGRFHVLLQSGWPEGFDGRLAHWQDVAGDRLGTVFCNVDDPETREWAKTKVGVA